MDTSQVQKNQRRRDGNHRGKHAERLALRRAAAGHFRQRRASAVSDTGVHGVKHNAQGPSAAGLLSDLEADGAAEHGGKVRPAGALEETEDALQPTRQAIQALDSSIATSSPPAARAEPREVAPVDEASGTQLQARRASVKKFELVGTDSSLWGNRAGICCDNRAGMLAWLESDSERLKGLLTFF